MSYSKSFHEKKYIVIMKQDKGRGIVVLNRWKHTEKCLAILNTEQFRKLYSDPTKSTERKMQRVLRKIKNNLSAQEYPHLCPTCLS